MPDIYEITEVGDYWPNPETPCWYVDMRRQDGGTRRHIFPKATPAYRAAEYGIDPADIDQLLDIILHEPFAPHPDDAVTAADDPAIAAGLMSPALTSRGTVRAGDLVPTTLYTAGTTEQAREAHLLRIRHAKQHVGRVTTPIGNEDLLAPIKRSPVDRAFVTRHTAWVTERRAQLRGDRPPPRRDILLDSTADDRLKEKGHA